jgi:hypothetical protein
VARRFRVFHGGSALSRNSSTNQDGTGQNSIKTTQIDLNFAGRFLGVLRRYLQDINTQFQAYHEKSKKNKKALVLET